MPETEPGNTAHYAVLYGGDKPYFRLATITHPAGTIAPPTLELHQPLIGPVKLSYYNGTEAGLARTWGLTPEIVDLYLKNGTIGDDEQEDEDDG